MAGTLDLCSHTIRRKTVFQYRHYLLLKPRQWMMGEKYWIYPNEEVADDFQIKHVLEIRHSVVVAKNVKRKDLVLPLLNWVIIETLWVQLVGSNECE